MAGKKRKSKSGESRTPPTLWSSTEIIALLAWLDHTLKHKDVDFKSTVVDHFKNKFTLRQIEDKLGSLWGRKGPNKVPGAPKVIWRTDVYVRGSKSLDNHPHGLNDEQKREIAAALEEIENEYIATQLARVPDLSHRLRSSSRLASVSTVRSSQITTPHLDTNRTPAGRRQQAISITPSRVKREIRETESSSAEQSAGRKRLRTYSKRAHGLARAQNSSLKSPPSHQRKDYRRSARHTRSTEAISDSDEDVSDTLDEQQDDDEILVSDSDVANGIELPEVGPQASHTDLVHENGSKYPISCICGATQEVKGDKGRWILCDGCHVWQHDRCVDYLCDQCVPKPEPKAPVNDIGTQHEIPNNVLMPGPDIRLQGAILEIEELRDQLAEKKNELQYEKENVKALEEENGRLNAAKMERDKKHAWSIEATLEGHLKTINELHKELRDRDRLGKFAKQTADSRHRFGQTPVGAGFKKVYTLSKQLCRNDGEELPFIPILDQHKTLGDLACMSLGPTELNDASRKLSKLSPQAAVRALTTAALREWVFETDFPKFDHGLSPFLNSYRECIAKQDGAVALRNLDLAALNECVNETSFRNWYISQKAESQAIQLSQALAPLFSDTPELPSELDWDEFSTWRDDIEIFGERRGLLIEMFKDAFLTKADSCLNIEDYEMVTYPPGTKFDKSTMTVETMEGMSDNAKNHEDRTVQVCVEAAVYAFPRKELGIGASVEEAVVPRKNFVVRDERSRGMIKPLVRAVVVLCEDS